MSDKHISIEPQIEFKNGVWSGDLDLMYTLKTISSGMGILDHQLYKLILKEYTEYRSVYDMNHNYSMLLCCKAIVMCHTLDHAMELDDSKMRDVIKNIRVSKSRFNLYPVLPVTIFEQLKLLTKKVMPWTDIPPSTWNKLDPGSEVYEEYEYEIHNMISPDQLQEKLPETSFISNLYDSWAINFYGNWQAYSDKPGDWSVSCLDYLRKFKNLEDEEKSIPFLNVLERSIEVMTNNLISQGPIRMSLPKKDTISIWNRIKLLLGIW